MNRDINILGHVYHVAPVDHLRADHEAAGELNKRAMTIHYDSGLNGSRGEEAIMHEIFEALNYHLELELRHPQITALSESIYDTLKRNGWLKMREEQ